MKNIKKFFQINWMENYDEIEKFVELELTRKEHNLFYD